MTLQFCIKVYYGSKILFTTVKAAAGHGRYYEVDSGIPVRKRLYRSKLKVTGGLSTPDLYCIV
jgi:hypothetical protein